MSELVRVSSGPEGVAVFELNAPPANTYSYDMMRQLDAAVLDARMDAGVHVIVIRGAGDKFFCAGADIGMLQGADPGFKYNFCLHARLQVVIGRGVHVALERRRRHRRGLGQRPQAVVPLLRRAHPGRQPRRQRRLRPDRLAGQAPLQRPVGADPPGERPGRPPVRVQAQLAPRKEEPRVRRRPDQVGGARQRRPRPRRDPVDQGDDRLIGLPNGP